MINMKNCILIVLILMGIIAIDTGHFGYYIIILLLGIVIYKRDDLKMTYYAVRPGIEYMFRGRKR